MTSIWFPTISGLNVVPPYATPGTLLSYTTILNASDSWGSNSGIYPSGDDLYVRSRGNSSAQIVAAVLGGSLTVGHTLKIVDGAGVTWLISSPVVLGGTISGIIVPIVAAATGITKNGVAVQSFSTFKSLQNNYAAYIADNPLGIAIYTNNDYIGSIPADDFNGDGIGDKWTVSSSTVGLLCQPGNISTIESTLSDAFNAFKTIVIFDATYKKWCITRGINPDPDSPYDMPYIYWDAPTNNTLNIGGYFNPTAYLYLLVNGIPVSNFDTFVVTQMVGFKSHNPNGILIY